MPPQNGIAPRIRIGQRWINTLWGLPMAAAALLCLVALAQSLRELSGVEAFIRQHPGIAQAAPSVDSGFPWWLQLQHFLNMFFMLFIMRAGRPVGNMKIGPPATSSVGYGRRVPSSVSMSLLANLGILPRVDNGTAGGLGSRIPHFEQERTRGCAPVYATAEFGNGGSVRDQRTGRAG